MKRILLSPSLMCGNLLNLEKDIGMLLKNGVNYLHVDIADGYFAPNIIFGFGLINSLTKISIPRDIHLMVNDPEFAVKKLLLKKEDIVSFHVEVNKDISRLISLISKQCKIGLVVNSTTPLERLFLYLPKVDFAYLMTINKTGFSEEPFNGESYIRAEKLCNYIVENRLKTIVGVDGAIGLEQIEKFSKIGVKLFVLGTKAIYLGDLEESLIKLKKYINNLKN